MYKAALVLTHTCTHLPTPRPHTLTHMQHLYMHAHTHTHTHTHTNTHTHKHTHTRIHTHTIKWASIWGFIQTGPACILHIWLVNLVHSYNRSKWCVCVRFMLYSPSVGKFRLSWTQHNCPYSSLDLQRGCWPLTFDCQHSPLDPNGGADHWPLTANTFPRPLQGCWPLTLDRQHIP